DFTAIQGRRFASTFGAFFGGGVGDDRCLAGWVGYGFGNGAIGALRRDCAETLDLLDRRISCMLPVSKKMALWFGWTGFVGMGVLAAGIWTVDLLGTAHAQTNPAAAAANYRPLVDKLSAGRATVLSTFAGPDGLTGLVVGPANGAGPKSIAWGIDGENGPVLIPGPVLDSQGKNLSQQAAERHGVIPKPMAGGKLAQAMLAAPGFTVGTKGPLFTVFLDPNCIFCHDFWTKAYPLAKEGKLRFKVVPVGFLKPSSGTGFTRPQKEKEHPCHAVRSCPPPSVTTCLHCRTPRKS
ncbi:hypothetical protein, partial [Acidithiobacillus caldus]